MYGTGVLQRNARDIDQQVAKVLRGLGALEPPIRLQDVRELLRLDLGYYSSSDTGLIRETISRLKVAGKQVIARPTILLDAIRKRDLKALYVPDRKRILLDSELPTLKKRWAEGHEISHSIIPWHGAYMHGDPMHTLSLACEIEIEAEANFATGRLLFLRDRFREELLAGCVSLERIKTLSSEYGNTITSTLWRAVECCDSPAFGMVSQHPMYVTDEKPPIRYFVVSIAFSQEFTRIGPDRIFSGMGHFCSGKKRCPLADEEVAIRDDNGIPHRFHVECFSNSYDVLTLGTSLGVSSTIVSATH
jgi:hypothetical protein